MNCLESIWDALLRFTRTLVYYIRYRLQLKLYILLHDHLHVQYYNTILVTFCMRILLFHTRIT